MEALLAELRAAVNAELVWSLVQALLILLVGFVLSRIVRSRSAAVLQRLGLETYSGILVVSASWLVLAIAVAAALQHLGFDLSVILGAAGVFSVAIGFASQTSFSNVISGLFLAMERSFSVGDVIKVGTTMGEVLSVDLLSVKLRTFDNLYVRIPNEVLVKGEITNLSRFPIRRADFVLIVPYGEDLDRVRDLLMELAMREPLAMVEPKPVFQILSTSELGVQLQFSVWAARERFLDMKTATQIGIREALDDAGIAHPLPRRVLVHEPPPGTEPTAG